MKVSEILRMLNEDGWFLAATRGSHRQFKRATKAERVTVPGKPNDTLVAERIGTADHHIAWVPEILSLLGVES